MPAPDLSERSVTITAKELPLYCPPKNAPLWSQHPRVDGCDPRRREDVDGGPFRPRREQRQQRLADDRVADPGRRDDQDPALAQWPPLAGPPSST